MPPKLAAFNLPINQKKKSVELSQRKDEVLGRCAPGAHPLWEKGLFPRPTSNLLISAYFRSRPDPDRAYANYTSILLISFFALGETEESHGQHQPGRLRVVCLGHSP